MTDNLNWTEPAVLSTLFRSEAIGKLVTFSALHQAQLEQHMKITDKDGNPITFTTMSGEEHQFPISGQGTSVGFFYHGAGHFVLQEGYQISFANGGSNPSKYKVTAPTGFLVNGEVYGEAILFAVEDFGGEQEYDDTTVILEWYKKHG